MDRLIEADTLLAEAVNDVNRLVVLGDDGPVCLFCHETFEYTHMDTTVEPSSEKHAADCWVLRVRQFLARRDLVIWNRGAPIVVDVFSNDSELPVLQMIQQQDDTRHRSSEYARRHWDYE